MVSAQAIELRGVADRLGEGMLAIHTAVRSHCPPLGEDRPLGPDISLLAGMIGRNALPAA
jgi:histidine ammonia-lyase